MLLLLLLLLQWLIKVLFGVGIGSGSGNLTLAGVIIVRDDESLLIELGRRLLLLRLFVRHKFITTWQWRWCWWQVFTLLWLLLFIGVSSFTRGRFRRGCSNSISFPFFVELILQNDGLGKKKLEMSDKPNPSYSYLLPT